MLVLVDVPSATVISFLVITSIIGLEFTFSNQNLYWWQFSLVLIFVNDWTPPIPYSFRFASGKLVAVTGSDDHTRFCTFYFYALLAACCSIVMFLCKKHLYSSWSHSNSHSWFSYGIHILRILGLSVIFRENLIWYLPSGKHIREVGYQ
jgi:peptidoglycan biosynthesis protein MviN/MurJ (putative lipid II flippase)